jgi:hypothetical protein
MSSILATRTAPRARPVSTPVTAPYRHCAVTGDAGHVTRRRRRRGAGKSGAMVARPARLGRQEWPSPPRVGGTWPRTATAHAGRAVSSWAETSLGSFGSFGGFFICHVHFIHPYRGRVCRPWLTTRGTGQGRAREPPPATRCRNQNKRHWACAWCRNRCDADTAGCASWCILVHPGPC